MQQTIPEFWNLVLQSRLLNSEQCQKLGAEYGGVKGAAGNGNSKTLTEWLISRHVISRYQATILLAGYPGPFFYGDYRVHDRSEDALLGPLFHATHAVTQHPVVLQFVAGPMAEDPAQWRLLDAHVKKQVNVAHPHLLRTFEAVDLGDFKFLVLEDPRGGSLASRNGPIPHMEACRLVREAALGLHALHRSQQPHGDLRPASLWTDAAGQVRIARNLLEPPAPFSRQSPLAATKADYLAPELAGGGQPGPLGDIYALGCTLYELLSGRPPFSGGGIDQKLQRHAAEPFASLESFGVPPQVAQVISYMMAKNPNARIPQAAIVAEQLQPLVSPQSLSRTPAVSPSLPNFERFLRERPAAARFPQKQQPTPTPAESTNAWPSFSINPTVKPVPAFSSGPAFSAGGSAAAGAAVAASPVALKKDAVAQKKEKSPAAKKRQLMNILIGSGVAVAALVILAIVFNSSGGPKTKPKADSSEDGGIAANTDGDTPNPPGDGNENGGPDGGDQNPPVGPNKEPVYQVVVPDDGQMLWASPTEGPPVELKYVPPSAQIYLIARPAEMLASREGAKVFQALGPDFSTNLAFWERAAGVKFGEIDQLIVSLHDNSGEVPRPSFMVRLKTPLTEPQMLARWGNPTATTQGTARYYTGKGWAYFVPSQEPSGVFTMGTPEDIKELAAVNGAPPVLRREMKILLESSDRNRHFTLLFAPNYFFSDGRKLFSGSYAKVLPALEWFLGDDLTAGMFSMHFGDNFYLDMRMQGRLENEKQHLASDFRDRLGQVPQMVEDYIVSLNPDPYWKKAALRYPQIIRLLANNTRVGVENGQPGVNSYLEGRGAHNLVGVTEVVINSGPGGAVTVAGPAPTAGPKTLDEVLAGKMSIEFPQEDLINAVKAVVDQVRDLNPGLPFEFNITFENAAMEAAGITRNQAVRDFVAKDLPVADVLTGMVMKANPITTVKDPSEADQKLIWVVQNNAILITTRASAEKNSYKLPPAFTPK